MYRCYLEQFDGIEEKHIRFTIVSKDVRAKYKHRHLFYYLVERSPGDWTEENIGEKFLLLLKILKGHLVKQKMPHFFIG